jgi:hypothetical protein
MSEPEGEEENFQARKRGEEQSPVARGGAGATGIDEKIFLESECRAGDRPFARGTASR